MNTRRVGIIVRTALLAITGLFFWSTVATAAQSYPSRPVKIVAPFPPGTGTELIARELAHHLSTQLGQTFFVENKPGAGGVIGTQAVKNSAPDGYTLLVAGGGPLAINPALYRDIPYDPAKDFEPIRMIATVPNVLLVRADFPGNTLDDVIKHVKANPGKFNYASSGNGVPSHLIMEMLKSATGMEIMHVPYQGSAAALTALLAGQVEIMFDTASAALPHVTSGKLKVVATVGAKRTQAMPNVPTIAESGISGFAAQGWSALVAPAGTPKDVVRRLSTETGKILDKEEVQQRLVRLGVDPVQMDLDETSAFMKSELVNWAKAVEISGARID